MRRGFRNVYSNWDALVFFLAFFFLPSRSFLSASRLSINQRDVVLRGGRFLIIASDASRYFGLHMPVGVPN